MSKRKVQCPNCIGTGVIYDGVDLAPEPCERCNSNGFIEAAELSDDEFKNVHFIKDSKTIA